MSEQVIGIFNTLEDQHLDEVEKELALQEVMLHLQTRSAEHSGDASRPDQTPLVDQYGHLAERQTHVAEILSPAERQVEIVRQMAAACALATPDAHFLDPRLEALATSMKDEVIREDGKPKIPLETHREILTKERKRLAQQLAQLILEKNLLCSDLPVTINGDPDRWHSQIGRVDLATVLQRLLNTDPSSPDYPQIAQMYFALQQGVEDTTVARVFSPLNSRGKTLERLNEQSGVSRLPKEWRVYPFNTVADDELAWNPDTRSFGLDPLQRFNRVVMIPHALSFDHGPIGIPKIPTVSSRMNI